WSCLEHVPNGSRAASGRQVRGSEALRSDMRGRDAVLFWPSVQVCLASWPLFDQKRDPTVRGFWRFVPEAAPSKNQKPKPKTKINVIYQRCNSKLRWAKKDCCFAELATSGQRVPNIRLVERRACGLALCDAAF